MSATNDAGKLLLTPKGEYSGSTTYEVMDTVYYITSSVKGVYVAKGTTTGNLPTDTTKWNLLIDLGDFITDATLATSSTVGLVKPDGITDEVDALGVLTALGVVIKATIDGTATAYSATWLKVGNTTLTPSTKQMYRVTENSVECLYYWNGTNYAKIPAGHTIVNSSGTAMTTRSKMKFVGANVTDDSTNDQTVITITGGGGSSEAVVDLVHDTVGFTGKNRAYSQTNNAVIASIESGKTYSVSWTGSATITLKKDSASGTEITSGSTSPLTFTADADYDLYFGSSDDVTQIMVCYSELYDGVYEANHDSVETMFEDVADDIDGINLLDYDLASLKEINTTGTWSNNSYTLNGATLTLNSDKSISLISSGAVSANVIFHLASKPELPDGVKMRLSGCPKGGSASSYEMQYGNATNMSYVDRGDGVDNVQKFDYNTYPNSSIFIKVWAGANIDTSVTFFPMITEAKYAGTPFRPYNQQSIQNQLNAQTGITGVRNLLENTATTKTEYGVTFTVNDDGTVTVNGTATENTWIYVARTFKKGTYIYSSCPQGGSDDTYKAQIQTVGGEWSGHDYGNGTKFTVTDESQRYYVYLSRVMKNATVSNLTFKPMIRLASDPSDEYVPFAMTNRELTEGLNLVNVATASANQTWSTQLSILNTAFTALNETRKRRARIYVGGDTYYCGNIDTGGFQTNTCANISDVPNVISKVLRLSQGIAYRLYSTPSGNTIYDDSSENNINSMFLMA